VACTVTDPSFDTGPRVHIENVSVQKEAAVRACHQFVRDSIRWTERAEFKEYSKHRVRRKKSHVFEVQSEFESYYAGVSPLDRKFRCLVKNVGEGKWARGSVFLQPPRDRVGGGGHS